MNCYYLLPNGAIVPSSSLISPCTFPILKCAEKGKCVLHSNSMMIIAQYEDENYCCITNYIPMNELLISLKKGMNI